MDTRPFVDPSSLGLRYLRPLRKDQYITAFGCHGRFLFGTQEGYAGAKLPDEVIGRLESRTENEIVFASFGDDPGKWFVAYFDDDTSGDHITYDIGSAVSPTLRCFYDSFDHEDLGEQSFLRVQFGGAGSYVAWTNSTWISENVPWGLSQFLMETSKHINPELNGGTFRSGHPTSISWHGDGSYYIAGPTCPAAEPKYHVWKFASGTINDGWKRLWNGSGSPTSGQLQQLVHVAINPHTPNLESYVFIKASREEDYPDFVLCFAGADPIARLTPGTMLQTPSWKQLSAIRARATKTGRPHPDDEWELEMKKGEFVTVVKDKGKNWVHVQNSRGDQGYAHKSWLDFDWRDHQDVRESYHRYRHDTAKLFDGRIVSTFPDLSLYVQVCREYDCTRSIDIGICVHQLEKLLRGWKDFSVGFLKEERNKWHPDRFARICDPSQREMLAKKAEGLFVMMTMIMDALLEKPKRSK